MPHRLDQADRAGDSVRGIVLQTERQREVEQDLGVGLSGDLGIQRFVDREHEVALDRGELGEEAVVHEQPATVAERMTVGLLDRRPDRRTDMREEMPRGDMAGELAEILVVPRRLDTPEHTRRRRPVIPGDAESIAVGWLGTERRVQALVYQ